MSVNVDCGGGRKTPCLLRPWQHTIKAFTPAMNSAASGRLKEKRIRGIGKGEKGTEAASMRPTRLGAT